MPEPSRLVLLEQLPTLPSGTKVRFLACIHSHNASDAQLILRDKYPATTAKIPTALVNIENVLENIHHELLQVGAWVSIIGYVRALSAAGDRKSKASKHVANTEASSKPAMVDATMIWSAGAIKFDKYKSAAREYQQLASND